MYLLQVRGEWLLQGQDYPIKKYALSSKMNQINLVEKKTITSSKEQQKNWKLKSFKAIFKRSEHPERLGKKVNLFSKEK